MFDETKDSANFETFGGALSDLVSLLVQTFVVADIVACQEILCIDFLTQNRGKGHIEKKTLKLGNVKIWLKSSLDSGICRVQLLESTNCSPYTESFV
jgi:hypothetical protein